MISSPLFSHPLTPALHFFTALKDKQENAAFLKQPSAICGSWTDCEDPGMSQQSGSHQSSGSTVRYSSGKGEDPDHWQDLALQRTLAMVRGIGESNKNFRWRLSAFLSCALLSHEAEHSSHPMTALPSYNTLVQLLMCPRDIGWWSNNLPQERQKSVCPAQQRTPFFRGFRLLAGTGSVVSTQNK